MSCAKTFTITVNDGVCAFIDDLVWAVLFPFPPDGIKSGSGDGGVFEAFCSTTAAEPEAALVTLSTSFVHESGNINLRVRFETVIDASPGTAFGRLNFRRNGVLIFTQVITTSGTRDFYFQLTDGDAGATYAIDIPVRCNDYSGADKSITINGTIECVDSVIGVGNEQQQGDYDCSIQCSGPGGHVTIPAGTWFRDTLAEANAAALAFAENQAFNIAVCCCTDWVFDDEDIAPGASASHNGGYLSATYGIITTGINQVVRISGTTLVPSCAIPSGATNIVVTINYAGFGDDSVTYIWDYYDPDWFTGVPLASQAGAAGSLAFSRPVASGTGVMFRVNAADINNVFNGTATVTISFT